MKKNTLEWAVFGASLALIASVAALLVYQHFTGAHEPASLVATIGSAVETAGGFAVPISVRNEGNTTAEDVRLQATLKFEGGSETGEAVIPYVPYRSKRRAWIAFSRDPRAGRVTARVLGYREP
jgi:uncharacterized protein (TIGR02588 family)